MKPLPFCLSPSKFGGGDGFKSILGRVAEASGSCAGEVCGIAVCGFCVIVANNRRVVFSASSTWVFFASWLASLCSISANRESVFPAGSGLAGRDRSISSNGEEVGGEGNSGGVTASCSSDEAEIERSRKRGILAGARKEFRSLGVYLVLV
jgi:hypothetical protein